MSTITDKALSKNIICPTIPGGTTCVNYRYPVQNLCYTKVAGFAVRLVTSGVVGLTSEGVHCSRGNGSLVLSSIFDDELSHLDGNVPSCIDRALTK